MQNQQKLFSYGMKPYFRIMPKTQPHWIPVTSEVTHQKISKDTLEVTWDHFFFTESIEQTYFAFCQPFSYSDLQAKLSGLDRKLQQSSKIYFMRELLTLSLDGRRVDLLTFTSVKGLTFEREPLIEGLFPTAFSAD